LTQCYRGKGGTKKKKQTGELPFGFCAKRGSDRRDELQRADAEEENRVVQKKKRLELLHLKEENKVRRRSLRGRREQVKTKEGHIGYLFIKEPGGEQENSAEQTLPIHQSARNQNRTVQAEWGGVGKTKRNRRGI